MANYRAIGAACKAIISVLESRFRPGLFDGDGLEFAVYSTSNFATPMTTGVSLYLYHVGINMTQRRLPARPDPITGRPRQPQLPVDLSFILTPWARDASVEHQILGWMMRVLEDTPTLGSQSLNAVGSNPAFNDDESVEIVAGQMTNEEMFRIWDVLPGDYRLSVPYIARVVRIDTEITEAEGQPVIVRELDFGKYDS
jgi:hypothetical protein